jgi:hypothetical protein
MTALLFELAMINAARAGADFSMPYSSRSSASLVSAAFWRLRNRLASSESFSDSFLMGAGFSGLAHLSPKGSRLWSERSHSAPPEEGANRM